ncbi:MAG TPA: hypothetical protein VFF11_09480, partial [Candidatus Binatia bacterium]|nr:hypothetical protein [Candidatus Binatia bacterium]
ALKSVSQDPPGSSSKTGYYGLYNPVDPNGGGDHYYCHDKVMVWSAGPDKNYDLGPANAGKNKDNILSWK